MVSSVASQPEGTGFNSWAYQFPSPPGNRISGGEQKIDGWMDELSVVFFIV